MKIRTDFVTNSSSSSFIVIVNKNFMEKREDEDFYNGLKNLIIKLFDDYDGNLIESPDDVLNVVKDIYDYNDLQVLTDESSRERYNEYIEYINNNNLIYFLRNIYDGNSFYDILRNLENIKSDNFIIKDIGEL